MHKGQISSYDIMLAFIAFILIFISMNFVWHQNFSKAFVQEETLQTRLAANQALEVLIKSGGRPSNWEAGTASPEIIGLATQKNVLSEEKLDAFGALDYATAREKLKIGANEFQFELKTANPVENKSIGLAPPTTTGVIVLRRNVIYQGVDSNVFFRLFKT